MTRMRQAMREAVHFLTFPAAGGRPGSDRRDLNGAFAFFLDQQGMEHFG